MDRWYPLLLGMDRDQELHPWRLKNSWLHLSLERYHGEEKPKKHNDSPLSKMTGSCLAKSRIGAKTYNGVCRYESLSEGKLNLKRSGGEINN